MGCPGRQPCPVLLLLPSASLDRGTGALRRLAGCRLERLASLPIPAVSAQQPSCMEAPGWGRTTSLSFVSWVSGVHCGLQPYAGDPLSANTLNFAQPLSLGDFIDVCADEMRC